MLLQPAKNDVVVKQKRGGCGMYVQMLGRGAAIAHALAFAEFAHLCAWISDDAVGPVLLGSFRDDPPIVVMATERRLRSVAI